MSDLPFAARRRDQSRHVGQDLFRRGLLEYWEGRCAVTGLAMPELLRASHIRPWAACDSDAERLDVFNGLLLVPQLDAAFDGGFVSVADDGAVIVSPVLNSEALHFLGLDRRMNIRLDERHLRYLRYHRAVVFRSETRHDT